MAQTAVSARTVRQLVLDLHTDLANLDNYTGNVALIAALLETAENKVAIIAEHLRETRAIAGLGYSLVIQPARTA